MSTATDTRSVARPLRLPGEGTLRAGLAGFAAYHLLLAAWMAAAPHSFYRALGPFDAYNSHYIRDTATFNAALGAGLVVAVRRPAWRVPMLSVVTFQFALHTLNHLIDAGAAHPAWTGWFDFLALLASTLLLVGLLARARRSATHSPREGGTP